MAMWMQFGNRMVNLEHAATAWFHPGGDGREPEVRIGLVTPGDGTFDVKGEDARRLWRCLESRSGTPPGSEDDVGRRRYDGPPVSRGPADPAPGDDPDVVSYFAHHARAIRKALDAIAEDPAAGLAPGDPNTRRIAGLTITTGVAEIADVDELKRRVAESRVGSSADEATGIDEPAG